MKKAAYYFLYILTLIIGIYLFNRMMILLSETHFESFQEYFYKTLMPIFIGIIMAGPEFIRKMFKPGKVIIDWAKLFIVGVPLLVFHLLALIYFFTPFGRLDIFNWIMTQGYTVEGRSVIGVVLGYILLSSFEKQITESNEHLI